MDNNFINILLRDNDNEILEFINNNGKKKPYSPIFFFKKEEEQVKEEFKGGKDNE